jgi:hypothetical protein
MTAPAESLDASAAALMDAFLRDCGGDSRKALTWACRHLADLENVSSAGFRRSPPQLRED